MTSSDEKQDKPKTKVYDTIMMDTGLPFIKVYNNHSKTTNCKIKKSIN